MIIVVNSVRLNAAADALWKWEQTGRTDKAFHEEATKHITSYCELHADLFPNWAAGVILDTMLITVRIANGFPPNDGVAR
jgi:hypothetical protein